jgi:aspartate-semialdehyde dehydrogenase
VLFRSFCGPIAETRKLLPQVPAGTVAVILSLDATAEDGIPLFMGVNSAQAALAAGSGRPLVSAHPATALLALTLHPLQRLGVAEVVATVIQPASLFEEAGLTELFDQTRSIVALTSRGPAPVFGAQLAFNLLPAQGAVEPIASQLASLLGEMPVPRLQTLQGAVFHAVSASLYVRFAKATTAAAVRKALAAHPLIEPAPKPKHFGPVDAAGSDKLLFGAPRQDGADGVWLWVALDNLTRGGALNALEIAESIA